MSSKKYATPLRLEIKPSWFLFYLLVLLHLSAISILYFLDLNIFFLLGIGLLLIFTAYFYISRYALLKSSNAIVNFIWDANNEWILVARNGKETKAELLADSYIHPWMTILIFNCCPEEMKSNSRIFPGLRKLHPGYRLNVMLLKDNCNANDFRRLRVRLKVGKPIE